MSNTATGIGASVRRKEDDRFIRGRGRYTDDVTFPNQAHAYFLRSPHAHAEIKKIDTAKAMKMSGVVAIYTGQDLADDKIGNLICGWTINFIDGTPMRHGAHPALAQGKVRHVGDQVAVVIANSKNEAKLAAAAIKVDYKVLPHVTDTGKAKKSGITIHDVAPDNRAWDWQLGNGPETDAAIKNAHHITKMEIVNQRIAPVAMETRAANAVYDAARDHFTVYATSQNPHVLRLVLSAFNGIASENKIHVISPDMGGGFGSKIAMYAEETVCTWATRKCGRPVKWISERGEAFLTDTHGRDHITTAELATDANGIITGLRVRTTAAMGAYLSSFGPLIPTILYAPLLSGQYAIPAIHLWVEGVYTNTTPTDAYRGAGRPEAAYLIERLVETAARELKIDPAEFRRRNMVKKFPHQTPVFVAYDNGDYVAALDKALELGEYKTFAARKAESAKRGKLRGVGFSAYIEACGLAPSNIVGQLGAAVGFYESAEVRVNPVGTIEVMTGSHAHGQGHETTFAQVVADRLGVDIGNVNIVHGDTDKVQFGMGTYGSRSGAVGITALMKAMDKIEAKGKRIAAALMEASAEDVEFRGGEFIVKGTDKKKGWVDISLAAYIPHKYNPAEIEPGWKESAFWDPPNFVFPAGVHICEVEVDGETGHTDVVSYTAVDDFGTIINPMIVEGQVQGGVAQGIGQALTEGVVYDDDSGQLITGSFMDYQMPRARDLPHIANFRLGFTNTPATANPLGLKGCGEAGAIAATPAVINAITNAIGVRDLPMPATPLVVWTAMQGMKKAAE
jgi:aerobic carbon-monoxide dehydrogenase large subunit